MNLKISQLPHELQRWLAILLWKLILIDGWVSQEERDDLHESMKMVDYDEFKGMEQKSGGVCGLARPDNLDFEHAFVMFLELIRVALSDQKFALAEMVLIEKAAGLLGFGTHTVELALELGVEMETPQGGLMKNLYQQMKAEFAVV